MLDVLIISKVMKVIAHLCILALTLCGWFVRGEKGSSIRLDEDREIGTEASVVAHFQRRRQPYYQTLNVKQYYIRIRKNDNTVDMAIADTIDSGLGTSDSIRLRINERVHDLTREDANGKAAPFACCVCDHLLKRKNVKGITEATLRKSADLLTPKDWNAVGNEELENYYKFPGSTSYGYRPFMKRMMLSPRSSLVVINNKKQYACCANCQYHLTRKQMPTYAIANNNFTGKAPKELAELNPVELAFLSPTKSYGYCFVWQGGKQVCLKGSLGFYQVEQDDIARGIGQLWALGAKVVVLMNGKMTRRQKMKAKENSQIRVEKLVAAVKWLQANHASWKDTDVNKWRERFQKQKPVVIDKSKEEDDSPDADDANIEITEKFCVYYPDGSFDQYCGGSKRSYNDFKKIIMEARLNEYDLAWQCDLEKRFENDATKGDTWLLANLLQFPYGRGGFNEVRENKGNLASDKLDMTKFIEHLSLIAEPDMHRPLHALMLYNLAYKSTMLRSACSVVENGKEAAKIVQGLNAQDLLNTAAASEHNVFGGTAVSRKYLQYVKTVAGKLPHSNESAGKARMNMEAMCHNLGPPHAFLTVTFDDDNSFLLQAYAGCEIDDKETMVSDLSDEELRTRAKLRTELRLKYPGMAAFVFEEILDIVMEEVVGWDASKNRATERKGLFGDCFACTFAVEEQGRKSLHVHILIWTEQLKVQFELLNSSNARDRKNGAKLIAETFDSVASTKFFEPSTEANHRAELLRATEHKCDVSERKRKLPDLVGEQQLRNLRHKDGFNAVRGVFATCPHCISGQFTNEELIESYLMKGKKIAGLTKYPDRATRRLQTMAIQYQMDDDKDDIDAVVVNAAYNCHLSSHADVCFRCNKKKKRKTNDGRAVRIRPEDEECRMRLPDVCRPYTVLEPTVDRSIFTFEGEKIDRPFYILRPKRNTYDCFQNVSCPAISRSKLGCGNTNLSFIFPGPILSYTCKYQMKQTQKEDQAEFKSVCNDMRKMLEAGRRHESDRSEVMRMVIRSSYKHNSDNVVGAPMASYLTRTRHKSRFYHSHDTVWLPLSDMAKTICGKEPSARISYYNRMRIVELTCRHYLCRPVETEDCSFFDFTRKYKVAFMPKKKQSEEEQEIIAFTNTPHFKHPSYCESEKRMRQGIKERKEPEKPLIKVFQGMFPDSAQFKGNLFDTSTPITSTTDSYCFLVLMMFVPFRSIEDLTEKNSISYTAKLRKVYDRGDILEKRHFAFLQNVQDTKHNYLRYGRPKDELESRTHIYTGPENGGADVLGQQEEDVDPEQFAMDAELADFMDNLFEEQAGGEADDSNEPHPSKISFASIKQKENELNKYSRLSPGAPKRDESPNICLNAALDNFVKLQDGNSNSQNALSPQDEDGDKYDYSEKARAPGKRRIMKLYANKQRVKTNVPTSKDGETIELVEANGTADSINDWAKNGKLDHKQRRAFKNIVAQFILTFYRDADLDKDTSRIGQANYRKEKKKLIKLAKRRRGTAINNEQLIMFLHGPGGSGKSTVIGLVMIYAQQFCELIDYPFTKNTIVISAMSGVAATLLHGRTTHSSCCLYRKPTTDDINAWQETRMLVVDEVSFGSDGDFENLDKKLRFLKHQFDRKYGGIHVIFAGDFRQLDPVGKDPIHVTGCERFIDWVNCYIELDGKHRFTDDPEWGYLLERFRDGLVTVEDIQRINERCIYKTNGKVPDGIQYASFDNRTRDRVNTEVFEKYVRDYKEKNSRAPSDAVLVFMDELYREDGYKVKQPIRSKKTFWQNCGESDVFTGRQKPRLDPVLKLFYECPVMLTHNEDVASGQANGTCALVEEVLLKPGEEPFRVQLDDGTEVKGVLASQVEHLTLRHCDKTISPAVFDLKAETYAFTANWPIPASLRFAPGRRGGTPTESIKMHGQQFPCVTNNATTGHKLQGKTVPNIYICNWNYSSNWVYVVLSRVKTRQGLFLQRALDTNTERYARPRSLVNMLKKFERVEADYPESFDE